MEAKTRRARAIAVLGTGSDVGKSLVCTALCRSLSRRGFATAPFKAQNMSLNSFVTESGGEMGRAQVVQAEACGIPPHCDMNPILLKPETEGSSQVIVNGQVVDREDARVYFERLSSREQIVRDAYDRLAARHDVIVIEGAGGAAELNLRDRDIVNWSAAHHADAAVILVGDIERGGVFAQLIGTHDLVDARDRAAIVGFIVNKFRGDRSLFDDGVALIEQRTGVPVLGVLPFVRDVAIDEEDGADFARLRRTPFGPDTVNVAVVLLPRMSNFTDFQVLMQERDVALRTAATPADLEGADVVILPGSKTTVADLGYLRDAGIAAHLEGAPRSGTELVGICGGYQMLGRSVADPHGVEAGGSADGLALLDAHTVLAPHKHLRRTRAQSLLAGIEAPVLGYEIHCGNTRVPNGRSAFCIIPDDPASPGHGDGAVSPDGRVWGTYLHGVFDEPGFRRAWLNRVRERKGLAGLPVAVSEEASSRRGGSIDRWTREFEQVVDVDALIARCGLGELQSQARTKP